MALSSRSSGQTTEVQGTLLTLSGAPVFVLVCCISWQQLAGASAQLQVWWWRGSVTSEKMCSCGHYKP